MSTISRKEARQAPAPLKRALLSGARAEVRPSARLPRGARRPATGRTLAEAAILGVVALLLVDTWLVARFTIDSSSMAENLLGPHEQVRCPGCGFHFAAGIEGTASDGRPAVCPNCGNASARLSIDDAVAGDGVLVDKAAFQWRAPRRWEVAAFRAPNTAHEMCVKRIVGLPGERIELIDGDVYADGQIVRKNLAERRALAIVVHDDRFRVTADGSTQCWQMDAGSAWNVTDTAYEFQPPAAGHISSSSPNWLAYHHVRLDHLRGEVAESAIVDSYGYNQTLPVGDLHLVYDLSLTFRVTAAGDGTLLLKANDGNHDFIVAVSSGGDAELRQGETVLARAAGKPLCGPTRLVELSLVDRSCVLAIDGEVRLEHAFESAEGARTGTARPFALASDNLSLEISGLCICRDVYYGRPPGRDVAGRHHPDRVSVDLGDGEFFVLADNSPLGLDSRSGTFGPAVPAKLLVGKPFVAHGGGGYWPSSWWGIQVPAPCEIRYIR